MKYIILSMAFLLPVVSLAEEHGEQSQGGTGSFGDGGALRTFLVEVSSFIFGPVLVFILALAFITFAWGVLKYFIADAEGDKSAAKSLMLWGILGFVLILTLFGIVNLIADGIGLGGQELQDLPAAPTPTQTSD